MAKGDFRWIEWNFLHATKHGCTVEEIRSIVLNPGRGYPRKIGDEKRLTIGRGVADRVVEVIYLLDDDDTYFVIHAMPLTMRRRRG
jgi:hypothetical protein